MLQDFSIVYFGNDWFAENRTSSHHIARLLGERMPVLYVETPGIRAPTAGKRDLTKLWRKLRRSFNPPQEVQPSMWVMTMPQIPFRQLPFVKSLNRLYGRYLIRRAMRRLGFGQTMLWFVVPHPAPLVGHLDESFVVYYCTDDYSDLPGVDRDEIGRLDDDVTRAADQVFVTAKTLIDRRKALNLTTTYAPHGVDFDHFHKASESDEPLAEGAKGLRHPVIGYFGTIAEWVDTDLIIYLAKARPDWTFLLIGMATVPTRELQAYDNIVLTGPVSYQKLPEWSKAFDVALLPFRVNQLTVASNPLKLREYLATGKPVVSSSLPEVERLAHCLRIARSPEEFIEKIQDALTNDTKAEKDARIREVMGSTWEARIEDVLQVVQTRMSETQNDAVAYTNSRS
jgi:glycosyltransferase involved in cell wall biosynthesis